MQSLLKFYFSNQPQRPFKMQVNQNSCKLITCRIGFQYKFQMVNLLQNNRNNLMAACAV
jgi:hypothetical protein